MKSYGYHFSLNVGLIFIKRVKFRNVLCKFVVKSGKLLELNSVKLALEHCSLACKLLCVIFGGEGNVNVKLVADILTYDLFLKSGDE